MWNPLTPAEVVGAMGGPAQVAGRSTQELTDWERGQLLSVYSATRHLAAELGAVEPHVPRIAAELAAALRTAPPVMADAAALGGCAARLDGETDPRALAGVACEALDLLRAAGTPEAAAVRAGVRTALKGAVELEVGALADAIEGPAGA